MWATWLREAKTRGEELSGFPKLLERVAGSIQGSESVVKKLWSEMVSKTDFLMPCSTCPGMEAAVLLIHWKALKWTDCR